MTQKEILIFVEKTSSRLRYVLNVVFVHTLGVNYRITINPAEFNGYNGPKFSYSTHPLSNELHFACRPLLFETGIKDQEIQVFEWDNHHCFFATNRLSALPFDPFAATFYMVSRYEEYIPTIRDSHDRFDAHMSLAWQNGFHRKPVVNHWATAIQNLIESRFPEYQFPAGSYRYICTIDVDNAFAFKHKGLMRTAGGYMKAMLSGDVKNLIQRSNVLMGFEKDPYDTFAHLEQLRKRYRLNCIYFILFAEYGLNDKNLPISNQKFRTLIKSIADNCEVGIHPSYGSNQSTEKLQREIYNLAHVVNREITKSRQHFLKLKFPETYKNLLNNGITDDYTMGFASEIGFRAGICNAYPFYDLDLESETRLMIHPFQIMDASLNLYMKLSPEAAVKNAAEVIEEVKKVNGTLITLWHNESISNMWPWEGWQNVLEEVVALAIDSGADVS
jgi:hypothetical protein